MKITRKQLGTSALLCAVALLPVLVSALRPKSPNQLYLHTDSRLMKNEISRKMPVGSDVNRARLILEENGFGCTVYTIDNTPSGSAPSRSTLTKTSQSSLSKYMNCDKKNGFFIQHRWFASFVFKNGKVTEITASHHQGPPK